VGFLESHSFGTGVAFLISTMEKNSHTKLYKLGIFVCAFTLLAGFQVYARQSVSSREHVRDIPKPLYPHSLTTQLTAQFIPFKPYVKGYVHTTVGALNMSLAESYLEHQKIKNDKSAFLGLLRSHWERLFKDVVRSEFRDFFANTLLGVSTRPTSSSSSSVLKSTDQSLLAQPLLFQLRPQVKIDVASGDFELGFEKKMQHGFIGGASFDTEHASLKGSLRKQISDDFYFHLKASSEFSDKRDKDFEIGFNFNF